MIEFHNAISIFLIGFVSLIITLFILLTGKKIDNKKIVEQNIFEIKVFNFKVNFFIFIYLIIIIYLFLIGVFSHFLLNSTVGFIFALTPFITYLILEYKKGLVGK